MANKPYSYINISVKRNPGENPEVTQLKPEKFNPPSALPLQGAASCHIRGKLEENRVVVEAVVSGEIFPARPILVLDDEDKIIPEFPCFVCSHQNSFDL